jgi:NTE family protein
VVLSSGGAKGAYAVGVLMALFSGASPSTGGRPLDPDVYCGTSIGAYNAAFLTAFARLGARTALERLVAVWRQRIASTPMRCDSGLLRLRGMPLQYLTPGCLVRPFDVLAHLADDAVSLTRTAAQWSAALATASPPLANRLLETLDLSEFVDPGPLYELVETTIDHRALAGSPKSLSVVTADWRDGTSRLFDRAELGARPDLRPVIASMSIPGILPEVEIDGGWYVDGALSMPTPLKPAIQDGADVLHVVYVDPLLAETRISPTAGTFETMMRIFAILTAEQVRSDVEYAATVNRGIELLSGRAGAAATDSDTELLRALALAPEIQARLRSGLPRRLLTIHQYRPGPALGDPADYFEFALDKIDQFMALGYRDAAAHDCVREKCVLPERKRT